MQGNDAFIKMLDCSQEKNKYFLMKTFYKLKARHKPRTNSNISL